MSSLMASFHRRHPRLRSSDEYVDIDRLISPLRYDVLVREEYFRFLHRNRNLHDGNFDAFVELARRERYYAWFRSVAIHRIRPGTPDGGDHVEAAFRDRLRKTTRLADQFAATGFDPAYPIILRTAGPVAVTDSGKSVAGRLFPSDGCHRLALLRLTGHRLLRPGYYRVQVEGGWQPPDNTGTLITALGLTAAEYFAFLSLGYTLGVHANEADLLAEVPIPAKADELRRIIAIDAPRLQAVSRQ